MTPERQKDKAEEVRLASDLHPSPTSTLPSSGHSAEAVGAVEEDTKQKTMENGAASLDGTAESQPSAGPLRRLYQVLFIASPSPPRTTVRKRDFGFLPIPKDRRHEPGRKPEEQFVFTWRLNLLFAASAVSLVIHRTSFG